MDFNPDVCNSFEEFSKTLNTLTSSSKKQEESEVISNDIVSFLSKNEKFLYGGSTKDSQRKQVLENLQKIDKDIVETAKTKLSPEAKSLHAKIQKILAHQLMNEKLSPELTEQILINLPGTWPGEAEASFKTIKEFYQGKEGGDEAFFRVLGKWISQQNVLIHKIPIPPGTLKAAGKYITYLNLSSYKHADQILKSPDFKETFPNLVDLSIFESELSELPPLPESLKKLSLGSCEKFRKLPEDLPAGLRSLNLFQMNGLDDLPKSLPKELRFLEVSFCEYLTRLPDSLPEKLESMKVTYCKNLLSITENLPKTLKELFLSHSKGIQKLPNTLPDSLETVILMGLENLKNLPDKLPKKLTLLNLQYCDSLAIPDDLDEKVDEVVF